MAEVERQSETTQQYVIQRVITYSGRGPVVDLLQACPNSS